MKKNNLILEKLELLKNNPKFLFYWIYKFVNLFKKNTLNNGERYDPNILNKFNINDPDQEGRYHLAKKLITKTDNVLDIACGTGYGTLMLSDECYKITGADISEKAIRYANKKYKKNKNINFINSELFSLNELFDVVISFETIEHIDRAINETVLKLLSLTKNKLICSVPYMEPSGHNKYHVHFGINESDFNLSENKYKKQFLYQSNNGQISEQKKDNTQTLIIIIDKQNNQNLV